MHSKLQNKNNVCVCINLLGNKSMKTFYYLKRLCVTSFGRPFFYDFVNTSHVDLHFRIEVIRLE